MSKSSLSSWAFLWIFISLFEKVILVFLPSEDRF